MNLSALLRRVKSLKARPVERLCQSHESEAARIAFMMRSAAPRRSRACCGGAFEALGPWAPSDDLAHEGRAGLPKITTVKRAGAAPPLDVLHFPLLEAALAAGLAALAGAFATGFAAFAGVLATDTLPSGFAALTGALAAAVFRSADWAGAEALTVLIPFGVRDFGLPRPFEAIPAVFAEVFSFLAILVPRFRRGEIIVDTSQRAR